MSRTHASARRPILVGLVGNTIDHFDTALYGFFAPIIAPLIFPDGSFVTALIKTYGLMSLSVVTRPAGAWFFGKWGTRFGTKLTLSWSLSGLGLVTLAMGLLPTYDDVGEIAPFILAILRLAQGFFGAGESTIAPFFVLQWGEKKRRGFIDSIYGSTTVLGELLASFAALLVYSSTNSDLLWRLPFLLGASAALVSVYLRVRMNDYDEIVKPTPFDFLPTIRRMHMPFIKVIAVSGMSYITYALPFVFFNGFIPEITNITYSEMMAWNTGLLALDMILAPAFGWVSDRVSHGRFMALMALLLTTVALPLFMTLEGAGLMWITCVRMTVALIGLGFCAPLHAWFMTQFPGSERYLLTGLAYAIGSQLFGRSTPAICFMLWTSTGLIWAPALYVMLVSGLALVALSDHLRVPSTEMERLGA